MARYDYKCSKCEHLFEVQHSIHDEPKIKCEKCKTKFGMTYNMTGNATAFRLAKK